MTKICMEIMFAYVLWVTCKGGFTQRDMCQIGTYVLIFNCLDLIFSQAEKIDLEILFLCTSSRLLQYSHANSNLRRRIILKSCNAVNIFKTNHNTIIMSIP